MKKAYSKPEIFFENFTMSTSIAAGCEGIVGNPSDKSCAVISSSGDAIFSGTVVGCDFKPEDMGGLEDEWDGFCYHNPTEYNNLFNS